MSPASTSHIPILRWNPETGDPTQPMQRVSRPGLDLTLIPRGNVRELHLALRPLPGEAPTAFVTRLNNAIREYAPDAEIVKLDAFGATAGRNALLGAMRARFGRLDLPVTWVEGEGCTGTPLAGITAFAIAGTPVKTLTVEGRPAGRIFDDGTARHVFLGDLLPANPSAPPADQARNVFERMEAGFRAADMPFNRLARTWFFLDQLLDWYGPFNAVRTDFYGRRNMLEPPPASTGVDGRNAAGAALTAAAWAVEPKGDATRVQGVASPLQCPAPAYGSSFSRATEIAGGGIRRIVVSGTASIAPGGETTRLGDVRGQVNLTMDVVGAILVSRGMRFQDTTRAVAYFKDAKEAGAFEAWLAKEGLPAFPVIVTRCGICRDDLLFELELDAVKLEPPSA
jgi:enamine deaminase RidA (YjgF/YER057c/UK114 family)